MSTWPQHVAGRTLDTPAYLVDLQLVHDRAAELRNRFLAELANVQLIYPVKANPVVEVADAARRGGYSFAEVSSEPEAAAARAAGFRDDRIVVGGVGKQRDALSRALSRGSVAKLDSPNELRTLAVLCDEEGRSPAGLQLRVATFSSGRWSRFGFLPEELPEAIDAARRLDPESLGFHFHLGSCVENPWAYTAQILAVKPWLELVARLGGEGPLVLSVGGGFQLIADTFEASVKQYVAAVASGVHAFAPDVQRRLTVAAEPGRVILESAGWLLATVRDVKLRPHARLAVLDVTQSMLRSGAPHEVLPIDSGASSDPVACDYTLVGCLSYEADVLVDSWRSPVGLEPGDRLALGNSGAYALASAAAWTRPIPPVLGWDGRRMRVLRPPLGWPQEGGPSD